MKIKVGKKYVVNTRNGKEIVQLKTVYPNSGMMEAESLETGMIFSVDRTDLRPHKWWDPWLNDSRTAFVSAVVSAIVSAIMVWLMKA